MPAASKARSWKVEKKGGDLFIRVPAAIRKLVNKNSRMTIKVDTKNGPLEVSASFSPQRKRRSSLRLEDLIGHIKNSKKGGLIDFGPAVGKETR